MKRVMLACLVFLMLGGLLVAGCGADVSAVVGKYAGDAQGEAARTIGATSWTFEFKEDGTFEEVIVIRNTDKRITKGTYEISNNSITLYDINGGLMEDDFTIEEDRLIDQLGGVWVKQ